jgi:hypothetical protein
MLMDSSLASPMNQQVFALRTLGVMRHFVSVRNQLAHQFF